MIARISWAGYFRRSWFWPHLLLSLLFVFQVWREGVSYDSMISSFGTILSLVLMIMLFLGLNEGREELNRKTILKLRTLPISWHEECFGSALALKLYGLTLMAPVFLIFSSAYLFGFFQVNLVKWIEMENAVQHSSDKIIIRHPDGLGIHERMALRVNLFEDQHISDKSFAVINPAQSNLKDELMIKAKRITHLPYGQSEVELPESLLFRKANLKLSVKEVFLLKEQQSFFINMFNGSIALMAHGFMLSLLFILLGRKVSIEVGVFFILGCLLIKSVYSLLGEELLKEAVERLSNRDAASSRFTKMWWEPYLYQWTKILAEFEGLNKLLNFNSIMQFWEDKKTVGFPLFRVDFIRELVTFVFLTVFGLALLRPRET